jgi:peptidoglycan/LPS O-acetylase OafA/YrhL
MQNGRIAGFDGLRAIAVIFVFLEHRVPAFKTLHLGGFGVWLFFVLSGFLIVRILYEQRLSIERGECSFWGAAGDFFKKRAARIWPIYYLVMLVCGVISLSVAVPCFTSAEVPYYLTFTTNIYIAHVVQHTIDPFGHLWSLAVEEQFYLLFGMAFLLLPSRWIKPLCLAVVMVGLARQIYLYSTHAPAIQIGAESTIGFAFIALGGWFALPKPEASGDPSLRQTACLAGYFVSPFLFSMFETGDVKMVEYYTAVLVGLLLKSMRENQGTRIVRVLEWRPLAALGKISFGLYLYHYLITMDLLNALFGDLVDFSKFPPSMLLLLSFVASVAASFASWHLIESPILRRVRRKPEARHEILALDGATPT